MLRRAWYRETAEPSLVFTSSPEDLWQTLIKRADPARWLCLHHPLLTIAITCNTSHPSRALASVASLPWCRALNLRQPILALQLSSQTQ